MRVGNSSSKYDFEPELFEKDIKNKTEIAEQFRKDLKEVLYRDYKYHDGRKMTKDVKRNVLIEVHKKFIEGD